MTIWRNSAINNCLYPLNEQESPEMQETNGNQLPDIDLEPSELDELAKYPNDLDAFSKERPTKKQRTDEEFESLDVDQFSEEIHDLDQHFTRKKKTGTRVSNTYQVIQMMDWKKLLTPRKTKKERYA